MKTLLMSIKPIYSQAILAGEKTVEFRRVFGTKAAQAERVIIYESAPTMKIVGSFAIERVHRPITGKYYDDKANEIWHTCSMSSRVFSGIEREAFMDYMIGAKSPCAIYIKDVVRLEKPFNPRGISPKWRPPQSYMWCPDWISEIVKADDGGELPFTPAGGLY